MRAFGAVALLAASACAPTSLEGSLTSIFDLTYTHSDLAIANDQAALRFLRPVPQEDIRPDAGVAAGDDLVLKVVTTLSGQPVVPHYVFALDELLANGQQRGQLTRLVTGETAPTFPLIERGQFYVRQKPTSGQYVNGYFTVTFVEGIDAASGRTVYGNFEAKVL